MVLLGPQILAHEASAKVHDVRMLSHGRAILEGLLQRIGKLNPEDNGLFAELHDELYRVDGGKVLGIKRESI